MGWAGAPLPLPLPPAAAFAFAALFAGAAAADLAGPGTRESAAEGADPLHALASAY